jgi:hypothetical protein
MCLEEQAVWFISQGTLVTLKCSWSEGWAGRHKCGTWDLATSLPGPLEPGRPKGAGQRQQAWDGRVTSGWIPGLSKLTVKLKARAPCAAAGKFISCPKMWSVCEAGRKRPFPELGLQHGPPSHPSFFLAGK